MNKVLTIVLMFSAMAAVVPAQAVETRKQRQARLAGNTPVRHEAQNQDEENQDEEIKNQAPILNRKAVVAAVAVGAVATATYLYATATDCTSVVHAYCAGSQVDPTSLIACKDYLPIVPVIGCWFK